MGLTESLEFELSYILQVISPKSRGYCPAQQRAQRAPPPSLASKKAGPTEGDPERLVLKAGLKVAGAHCASESEKPIMPVAVLRKKSSVSTCKEAFHSPAWLVSGRNFHSS